MVLFSAAFMKNTYARYHNRMSLMCSLSLYVHILEFKLGPGLSFKYTG